MRITYGGYPRPDPFFFFWQPVKLWIIFRQSCKENSAQIMGPRLVLEGDHDCQDVPFFFILSCCSRPARERPVSLTGADSKALA